MKKRTLSCLLAVLLLTALLPWNAFALSTVYGMTLEPYAGGFSYSFFCDEEYVLFIYKTSVESGKKLLHSLTGEFVGQFDLPCTEKADRVRVEVEDFKGYTLGSASVATEPHPLPAAVYADHPGGVSEVARKARKLEIASIPGGVQVDFDFPGYDKLILKYRTAQQTGETPVRMIYRSAK